ncbi:hypothetical protein [Ignatzschineria sp. LJL83]
MKTNPQNTLVILFQHVDIFFNIIDYYNERSPNISDFQISVYESILQNYIRQKVADENDKKRIIAALSLHNLNQCDFLAYINDAQGVFNIQNDLLSVIRNMDSKRMRELGQPDLDVIYAQIKTIYDHFSQHQHYFSSIDPSPEFIENLTALIDTMQNIFSKIEHNVRALEGSAKRLSDIVDSHNFEQQTPTEQVKKSLKEITKIYQRNIQPTLAFLNEDAMTKDSSAMYLIRKIREMLSGFQLYEETRTIYIIEMRLLSFTEIITDIRRKLHRYIEMDQKQRQLYNAIEQQYNELSALVLQLLDSKLTGKTLSSQHEFFYPSKIFNQLTNWTRINFTSSLIELPHNLNTEEVDEYIRSKLNNAEALKSKKRRPIKKNIDFKQHLQKRRRVEKIKLLMQSFPEKEFKDLYFAIHQHLSNNLEQYSLKDIYDARAFLSKNLLITTTLKQGSIQYNHQELRYPIKKLTKKTQI